MKDLPQRTSIYIGPVTDSRVWDDFVLRPGDVVLSTPPKCGTTWSQAILMMLLQGAAEPERAIWRDSLWLDCGVRDQLEMAAKLKAQQTRRCIKSHVPLDGIPYHPEVTYLTVHRHPIDVHFSLEKHVANMKSDTLDFMYPDAPGAAFKRFLHGRMTDTGTDDTTLESILYHFRSFDRWAHLPNIHCFHYARLQDDLPREIRRYAEAIGVSADAALVDEIAAACDFSAMKEVTRAEALKGAPSPFADPAQFFHSATANKWVGRLEDAEIDAYRQRFGEISDRAEINWLEVGRR